MFQLAGDGFCNAGRDYRASHGACGVEPSVDRRRCGMQRALAGNDGDDGERSGRKRICNGRKVLHRQWDHDCACGVAGLSDRFQNTLRRKYLHPTI